MWTCLRNGCVNVNVFPVIPTELIPEVEYHLHQRLDRPVRSVAVQNALTLQAGSIWTDMIQTRVLV